MKLVFATNNQNKVNEVKAMLGDKFEILTLQEIGCMEDIPETSSTLDGNASQKSHYLVEHYNHDCFADDTGLEVEVLNGEPGVFSARYAGPQKNSEDNMDLLLKNLENQENRNARFRTVISLIIDGKETLFEGIAEGEIIRERTGIKGFGYDPIFQPKDYDRTFAEMTMEEKNEISHRALAVKKLVDYLSQL